MISRIVLSAVNTKNTAIAGLQFITDALNRRSSLKNTAVI